MALAPRVSVITPSYNQAAFLEQTIQSVLAQDYPNLEYLVVDGASQDGSLAIIQKYASRLAWWVSEPDKGQAEAVNKGFAYASGEIIGWVNSDDLYLPGAVLQAVHALETHPEWVLAYGDMLSIDAQGQVTNEQKFGDWGLEGLMRFQVIGQPAVFIRRAALEQVRLQTGEYLDTSYHYLLDHQLWLRMAQLGPIGYCGQGGGHFWAAARYHAGAKNVAHADQYEREIHIVANWMQEQPGLRDLFKKQRRQIYAGLHTYAAHYLLDGGMPGRALAAYLRSLWYSPRQALRHSRRMAFAFASLFVNIDPLRSRYLSERKQRYAGRTVEHPR